MQQAREAETIPNPYVIQMDKFAESMIHLSKVFLDLEDYKRVLTKEENEEIFTTVTDKVCAECENKEICLRERRFQTYQMMYEILGAAEDYGAELNVELKRHLQKRCIQAPRFLRETLETYGRSKERLLWKNKIVQNREGYAFQLRHFAKLLQEMTRELEAGIYEDTHLCKKIKAYLRRSGIKMMSSVFYITPQGKCEIHLTIKAAKGHVVAVRELASEIGRIMGKVMIPRQGERPIVGDEYCTIACVEGARFHTLQGVAKIGKDREKISGDTFLVKDLPGGKKAVALSDGMGSGEAAFRESTMVVEMLEELLDAGFPTAMAVRVMNAALTVGREQVMFSTVDACVFDLYSGDCEFVKAGAATAYLRHGKTVEPIHSQTLPIGVIPNIEVDSVVRSLESGDFVVLVTDGVLDVLPPERQDALMTEFITQTETVNPREMAHHILGKALTYSGALPGDDMTVIVVGIWRI